MLTYQERFRAREEKRVETHHERLESEKKVEQNRESRLRDQERSRQTQSDKHKTDAERRKELRIHIKQQNQQTYRASILP